MILASESAKTDLKAHSASAIETIAHGTAILALEEIILDRVRQSIVPRVTMAVVALTPKVVPDRYIRKRRCQCQTLVA